MSIQNIIANISGSIRFDTMEGKEYIVAPVVMLTEGVHVANKGPIYYPPEEIEKSAEVWNTKPIVVYHPIRNGQHVSAADPDILTNRKVGVVLNATYKEGKLVAEAWLEKERVETIDDRILEALEAGNKVEVSTGLFLDAEENEGVWNDEQYTSIAKNFRPDHLAILPDKKGACSIEDGCGLLANAMAHEDLRDAISALLEDRLGRGSTFWIASVFDKTVVYEYQGKFWSLPYTKTQNTITLSNDAAQEVRRNVQYRTLDGKLVGNAFYPFDNKEKKMAKKEELVGNLIACNQTKWTEDDKEFLSGLTECQLEKMIPVVNGEPGQQENEEEEPAANEQKQPVTVEQYVANAPEEIRDMLQAGLQAHKAERAKLIGVITTNERNTFTKEQLVDMPMNQLKALAKLAAVPEAPKTPPNYAGAYTPSEPAVNEEAEEPLVAPTMSWE